jgi:hypothetical protein
MNSSLYLKPTQKNKGMAHRKRKTFKIVLKRLKLLQKLFLIQKRIFLAIKICF